VKTLPFSIFETALIPVGVTLEIPAGMFASLNIVGFKVLKMVVMKSFFFWDIMSYSTIGMIKSRKLKWAGHVLWMKENRNTYRLSVGKP
jgi:uncharacterized Rossmann fold enzyme